MKPLMLAALVLVAGCGRGNSVPQHETNAAALEARLLNEANAMEAEAGAAADRNAANAINGAAFVIGNEMGNLGDEATNSRP